MGFNFLLSVVTALSSALGARLRSVPQSKYSIPSKNAKEVTWFSTNEKYALLYKWSNGKTYPCRMTPEYCSKTETGGKVIFKHKGKWDQKRDENKCLWGIYVSYE